MGKGSTSGQHTLLVLYGSETGNAQDVAERISREAARRHYTVSVLAMDEYEVTELPGAARVVFVTSTMGQGDPPSNMKLFWRFLLRRDLPHDSLARLAFATFGLGDSHYQKYNVTAKKLHKRLEGLGAHPLIPLGLGDDQHPTGYEATLGPWLKQLWATLRASCPLVTGLSDPPEDNEFVAELDPCRLIVEVAAPADEGPAQGHVAATPTIAQLCAAAAELDRVVRAAMPVDPKILRGGGRETQGGRVSTEVGIEGRADAAYGPKNPLVTTVLSNDYLTAEGSGNEARHVVIDVAELPCASSPSSSTSGGSYAPGDCLAVMPWIAVGDGDSYWEGVTEVLRRAGLAPDALVRLHPAMGVSDGHVPATLSARTLIAGALDITSASPRQYFFEVASHFARDKNERERLRYFASAEGRDDLYRYNQRERRTVLEILDDFKSVEMPLGWMLQVVPRLQPRLFSISSSPLAHPGQIHLTVSLVNWKTHYGRRRLGLCSNMIAAKVPGAKLAVWLEKGTLRLPPPATPIIIVCTGSGVAPFRSFVHERATQRLAGAKLGPTLVFFGCRSRHNDFLYKEEWERFSSPGQGDLLSGDLDVLNTGTVGGGEGGSEPFFVAAFSRDGPEKDYVTHRIRRDACRVWGMISAGAHVFVAGSSGKMPEDVLEAFKDVACQIGGMEPAEAKKFFARMDAQGRYTVEAW